MLERLEEIAKKHEDLRAQQADPEVAVDPNRSREVAQKLAELEPVVAVYREYRSTASELDGAREIAGRNDVAPIGLLYKNEAADRYDLYAAEGLATSRADKIAALKSELNQYRV